MSDTYVKEKKRIWELDFIRGFCVLLMVFDHLFLTLFSVFATEWFSPVEMRMSADVLALPLGEFFRYVKLNMGDASGLLKLCYFSKYYWTCGAREFIHPIIFCAFLFLCGLCCNFSKSNLKRGLILAVVAGGITAVTTLMDESAAINFGVIHLLCVGLLLWELINVLARKNKAIIAGVSFLLAVFIILIYISLRHTPSFVAAFTPDTPFFLQIFFDSKDSVYFSKFMYDTQSKSPGDFFPILPWLGVFFAGAAASPLLYPTRKSLLPALDGKWNKPLSFLGRHSLLIYVLHQVVIYAVLALLSFLFITPGSWVLF